MTWAFRSDANRGADFNLGIWPVLVGDEAAQERDTLVSSPIILYDYPTIAPERPGDPFDSAGIDKLLTLRRHGVLRETRKPAMEKIS